ncbi:flavoprotein [Streptomyces sulphureus]|uniref:flavoprotein n=1 Tax=Streptomyces sulphureus TaxID=47758 RepID=UPI00036E2AE3|nr:flavoprotein [Streptomyces sulphureus]
MASHVLYFLASAAPPVLHVEEGIRRAQHRGWTVCLGLTPTAASWLDDRLAPLAQLTGNPVRVSYPRPGDADVWDPADATLLAPATFNTVNHWAQGLTSTLVVGLAAEAIGSGSPLSTITCVNRPLSRHPQFARSVGALRGAGVTVVEGLRVEGGFPWESGLDGLAG